MTDKEIMGYIDTAIEKTVKKLKRLNMLENMDDVKYADISYMLTDYYQNGQVVPKIKRALDVIARDKYYDIIPMYYGAGLNICEVARRFGVDVSTIVRNKKRLCLQIYTMLL